MTGRNVVLAEPEGVEAADFHAPPAIYRQIRDAVATTAGIVTSAGTLTVIAAQADASPWWISRVVEIDLLEAALGSVGSDPPFAGSYALQQATSYGPMPDVLSPAIVDKAPPRIASRRRFSVDFGSGIVSAIQGSKAPITVPAPARIAAEPHPYTSSYEVEFGTLELIRADREIPTGTDPVHDDTLWVETDDGPTWLDMESIPYHGGGVMARQRHPE